MGAIKGVLLVFVSVLLFVSILVAGVIGTLSFSLEYNNVKAELGGVFDGLLDKSIIEENLVVAQTYCLTSSEYFFEDESIGYVFGIPCSEINQGYDAILDYAKENLASEFYYKTYDCNFLDCFEKDSLPFFLVSERAKNYWQGKFYWVLMVSLVLAGLTFLLAEKKSNGFIISGALLIVGSLPFMNLDWVFSFFSDKLIVNLLGVFFSESYTIFIIAFVSGLVLLVSGILFKIFKIGFKISNFFSKFSKKNASSAKEVSKEKVVKKESSKKEVKSPIKKLLGEKKIKSK